MKHLLTLLILIVITDPYAGLDYDNINVYHVNYCRGEGCPSKSEDEEQSYYNPYYDDYDSGYENTDKDYYYPMFFDIDFEEFNR